MKIAFIARSTLYQVPGGITVQVLETARHLRKLGVQVTVHLTDEKIDYDAFDLFHFFDITRPANILYHIKRSRKPFVLSPVLINYSEYDRQHRKGLSGFVFRNFSPDTNEYIKAVLKWILRKDKLPSRNYLWKGHSSAIEYILHQTAMVLPNSEAEYEGLQKTYKLKVPFTVVPNGIDATLFNGNSAIKNEKLVICAARIEGIKNQLNLIKALRNTDFQLLLIGDVAPNQKNYWRRCLNEASDNITFVGRVSQSELKQFYRSAKVHVLPSWFETCGLSSLEAAAMGCNIVVTDKGYTRDYFRDQAFYCNPGDSKSIFQAIKDAAQNPVKESLQQMVLDQFTWDHAARQTLKAYQEVLSTGSPVSYKQIKSLQYDPA